MLEINRLIRHGAPLLVLWAVSKGWLPEAAQGDVIEIIVIVATFAGAYLTSRFRDPARKLDQ